VDPPVDADPPVEVDPTPDPYPFVFGPTGTLQNVAVISSMQKVPVVGACEGAGWLPRLPSSSWPFGVATCCWPFNVPTCAETGDDTAGNTIAIGATTNAAFFTCAAICFMESVPSRTPFLHGCQCLHSALPVAATLGTWEEPGHVVGGNFFQAPMSGEKDRREGVPDSHSLKRHGWTRSCHATERSRLEEHNT
jgi:hypothetical protein